MMDSYRRSRSGGAPAQWFPLHAVNWGVVYVNDEQEFSVELLWVNPRWDARMGFTPLPPARRPLPDTHRVERTVSIAAPVDRVWSIVADHRGMTRWFALDTVVLEREGHPGAERRRRRTRDARTEDEPARAGPGLGAGAFTRLSPAGRRADFLPPGSRRAETGRRRNRSDVEHPVSGEDSGHVRDRRARHGQDARRRPAAPQEPGRVGLIRPD